MLRVLLVFIVLQILFFSGYTQTIAISGQITDQHSGEFLPMATIFSQTSSKGAAANAFGYYTLKLPKGLNTIEYRFIGYSTKTLTFNITHDTVINIALEANIELEEVKVTAENTRTRMQSTKVSSHVITAEAIDELPSLLGETDIIKELRSLPGVNAGAEGIAGLVVRGSGPDQNVVLFDGVPIYNINHLQSFFSVFNTDAIASAEMYKGAYPARYGGRISSVVDVRMREGNLKKFQGKISIGTIASKLTFEGPLIKDKASFILSARRTYLDFFAQPTQRILEPNSTTNYYFDDYNLKVNYIINNTNRVYLSGYHGKDTYSVFDKYNEYTRSENKQYMVWGNSFASARWNHIFGNNTFANITSYAYRYRYMAGGKFWRDRSEVEGYREQRDKKSCTHIYDYGLKADFDLKPTNNQHVYYGAQYIYHHFIPNKYSLFQVALRPSGSQYIIDTTQVNKALRATYSNEFMAYVEDEIDLGTLVKVNVGLNYSAFYFSDTLYHHLLPRLSLVYMPSERISLKLAAGRYSQYTFLVTNPTIGMPTDVWIQSTGGMKPMTGWQTVLGAMYNTRFELLVSAEVFYKRTQQVAEYKEMVPFGVFKKWSDIMEQGTADNYGFETMLEWKNNWLDAKVAYSHIRAARQFDGLNKGRTFYYTFDAPHNVNVDVVFKLNNRIDIGASWCYASGKLITLVSQSYANNFYYDNGQWIDNYNNIGSFAILSDKMNTVNQRNNHRLPPYHRLDIGINFTKNKKRGVRTWSYGIYNVYNRKNAFYIAKEGDGYKQNSITTIIPYFAYSFKF